MSRDRKGIAPQGFSCDPVQRCFPPDWRDILFRRMAVANDDGDLKYQCPRCKEWFDHSQIEFLQGDHIWPYSLFGETSWDNYQLLCGSCNASKSNAVGLKIRSALGNKEGKFRQLVYSFLCTKVAEGTLELSDIEDLKNLVGDVE